MKKYLTTSAAIIIALAVTNVVTLGFFLKKTTVDSADKYPLVDIARNYIPQEHFIVNIQPLREKMNEIVQREEPDTVSVYYEFLNTGANIQINNNVRFYPASLVKIPSALVAMKKVERGEWSLNSRLVLYEQDKDSRYGGLYKQAAGTSFSIEELLKMLLIESDNTAHRMIMRNLSEKELDELRNAIGLDDLFDEKQEVSAKEYSRLFRALYNSSYLDRPGSQQILEWLTQTKFKQSLNAGVPGNTLFAHKIGEDDVEKNYLDSGIVYLPNRPYLITVMVKKHDQDKAEAIMKQISQAAYEYINGYGKK